MKPSALAFVIFAATAILPSTPAFAAHYTVGGSPNGTAHLYGAFDIVLPDQSMLRCDSFFFVVTVANGVAKLTQVVSGDFPICREAETDDSLPWTFQQPTGDTGPANVKINGTRLRFPSLGTICAGDISATLNNNGKLSFDSSMGACHIKTYDTHLSSNPILDAVYP